MLSASAVVIHNAGHLTVVHHYQHTMASAAANLIHPPFLPSYPPAATRFTRTPPLRVFVFPLSATRPSSYSPTISATRHLHFRRRFAFASNETVTVSPPDETEQQQEEEEEDNLRKRLYLANLPLSFSAPDIQALFSECSATISNIDFITDKKGEKKGYAFISVASEDEALTIIDKFNSYELLGRSIKVEFAKSLKKPRSFPPRPNKESRYVIYVCNLPWEVRSNDLREFVSTNFKPPISARVILNRPSGKATGYGFISFATEEEALAAIADLNGKELMGRSIQLQMSAKYGNKSTTTAELEPMENSEDLVVDAS